MMLGFMLVHPVSAEEAYLVYSTVIAPLKSLSAPVSASGTAPATGISPDALHHPTDASTNLVQVT
jgi:hypothetical protein